MKFIKYAVGLVIALSVIPMVVVAVNKLDDPVLRTIEFEVIDIDVDANLIIYRENTYNDIHSLIIIDNINVVNLVTVKINDVDILDFNLYYNTDNTFILNDSIEGDEYLKSLNDDDVSVVADLQPTIGDKWTMTFDVSKPLPPLVKLLVGFVPLLLAGGILLFMLNKRKYE